ncbi:MAG: hypothetical protein KDI51_08150, partial [Xanthomonadales bacterium]|nr:hypothetical protein [Xanthomonadales bacterium]
MSTTSTGSRVAVLALGALLSACASTPTQQASAPAPFVPTSALADDYWAWRVSYPTGRFDGHWLVEASETDRRIAKGLPAGISRAKGRSIDAIRGGGEGLIVGLLEPTRATELGPRPLEWSFGFPFGRVGGRTNVLLTHPSNPAVAWAGSDGGGVWKTTNCCSASTSWAPKTEMPELSNIAIGALALDPANADVIYAGTGDFRRNRPFTFGAGGLLKSVDGGENWVLLGASVFNPAYNQATGEFPQYRAISAVAVDPNDSERVVVGTNQGLYLSHDGGVAWTGPCFSNAFADQRQDITGLLLRDLGSSTELTIAVGAIGRPSAVRSDLTENGANGIYRSTVPGTASCPVGWTLLSRPDNGWPGGSGSGLPYYQSGGNPLRRMDLATAPSNPAVIYAQVQNLGVWRSADGGSNWTQTATQPDDFSTGCVMDAFGNGMLFQDYNAGIVVSPTDPDTLFLSATDVWRSTDGGQSFRNLSCGYDETAPGVPGTVHVDNHARAIVGGDHDRLLVGNDGGIYYSANATAAQPQFQPLNDTLATIEFYSGALSADFNDPAVNERFIGGGAQDNGASNVRYGPGEVPAAALWTLRSGGDGINVAFDPILAQRWYYSSQFLFIAASTNGYDGLADVDATSPDWSADRRGFLAPFRLYTRGNETTCPSASGCQRMLAGTFRVWEHLSGGMPNTAWYANSPDLTKQLSGGTDLSIINALEHGPADPTRAWVGTNDGNVWFGFGLGQGTTESATWVNLTGANTVLPNRPVMDIAPHPGNPGEALVGLSGFDQNTPTTPGHVYRVRCVADCASFDWADLSGNLPNIPVNALAINPHRPTQAFAGTDWGLYY